MANAQSVVIDHQNLGAHLAEGFKTGNSLIENEQRHPPAVGIPTQRQVSPGQKNFATLSRADMYERDETVKAAEITASAGNSAEDRSSRRLRNEWGKPRMTRDIELTTLEQVVVRGHVNKVEAETGRDMGPMRFGTTKEVGAVNLAHGGAYKPSDRQHLRRDQDGNMPGGVTVDLAKPDDGMFRARETVLDENNNAKRDSRGGVVERIVERQRDDERSGRTGAASEDAVPRGRPSGRFPSGAGLDRPEPRTRRARRSSSRTLRATTGRHAPRPAASFVRRTVRPGGPTTMRRASPSTTASEPFSGTRAGKSSWYRSRSSATGSRRDTSGAWSRPRSPFAARPRRATAVPVRASISASPSRACRRSTSRRPTSGV